MKTTQFRIVNEQVRANALAAVSALPTCKKGLQDGVWVVRIETEKKSRTQRQNRYLWGVVYKTIVDNDPGFFSNEITAAMLRKHHLTITDLVHEYCKDQFLGGFVFLQTDHQVEMRASTAKLDRQAFNEYVEAIRRWAASELEVFIPDPVAAGYDDLAWW